MNEGDLTNNAYNTREYNNTTVIEAEEKSQIMTRVLLITTHPIEEIMEELFIDY